MDVAPPPERHDRGAGQYAQWKYCPMFDSAHPNDAELCSSSCRWACNHPEEPHRLGISYDANCRACMIAAEAAIINGSGEEGGYSGHSFIPLAQWFAVMAGTREVFLR